jgi:glycosyltransferase involved in cell wall biosynthesis
MFLSIIIPTFNRHERLKQCLESLVAQTRGRGDIEINVIDDDSGPACAEKNAAFCKGLGKGLGVGYSRLKENSGASCARNAGIVASTGEWVALLDDDVCVEENWVVRCMSLLPALSSAVLGVEGKVNATGSGLWDEEVENAAGGAYLSCHMFYRREIVRFLGGFDEQFKSRYPSGEDHELATRVLQYGNIVFEPALRVSHLPRSVHYGAYLLDFAYRMRTLLFGDLYFYCKHRDRYHQLRHAGSFWGTYIAIAVKHLWTTLRRRSARRLFAHPGQLMVLAIATVLEQLAAIALFPACFLKFRRLGSAFFGPLLDKPRTISLWGLPETADLRVLTMPGNFFKSIFFRLTHKPVYSIMPLLQGIRRISRLGDIRIFLRIDDVFFENSNEIETLCKKMKERGAAFCAAIRGDDLMIAANRLLIQNVRESGGEIAVHGFSHRGSFGPFQSEILQLKIRQLEEKIMTLNETMEESGAVKIFIPPFNAVNREQILLLARYYKIVSCGPETARFTDRFIGPMALPGNSWYFPAFYPFYDKAANILKSKALREMGKLKGFLCIGVHMQQEAQDGFTALLNLVDRVFDTLTPWNYLP